MTAMLQMNATLIKIIDKSISIPMERKHLPGGMRIRPEVACRIKFKGLGTPVYPFQIVKHNYFIFMNSRRKPYCFCSDLRVRPGIPWFYLRCCHHAGNQFED
jgi:hypothetical protein